MEKKINVTIFNEFVHEKKHEAVKKVYPDGMHAAIAKGLGDKYNFRYGHVDLPEQGLTEEVVKNTDVMIWWGHMAHDKVDDKVVDRVQKAVLNGMGIIILHSGHFSKIFRRLMGTTCNLKWREAGEKERIWVVEPGSPIAEGLGEYFELEHTEMYGERFDIPQPDDLIFISWFQGGEVFRSGCCYRRGRGKIFYFRPGHETFPIYHNPNVLKVIGNAVKWAAPDKGPMPQFGNVKPIEAL